jgi:NSS family neurotransmitter:Na+ symporter
MTQDAWRSHTGFILAAMGSAIGLGNIWRFPFLAYQNGGGAFLIPYAAAVAVVGFSLMLAELSVGHRFRASQPGAFAQGRRSWEPAGWWAIAVGMLGVTLYYCVVIGWTINYFVYSLRLAWEPDPEKFFFRDFLGLTPGPASLGGVRWAIVLSTALVWGMCWLVVSRGIARGIERAIKVMMPLLGLLLVILLVWGLFLPGAGVGLRAYLRPDFSKLLDPAVWGAAVGQTFFSLSLGFGIMTAYARYLPERTNLAASAVWIVAGDTLFSIMAGMAVFATLGFMAHHAQVGLDEVVKAGPGLVFVVFPRAISSLPGLKPAFGALFFLTLFLAGVSSAISLIEALASAVQDKFGVSRRRLLTAVCLLGFAGSLMYTTGAGLLWLDIVDHHVTQYGLMSSSILMSVFAGWILGGESLLAHLGRAGSAPVGRWWPWMLRYPVPAILLVLLALTFIADLRTPYEGYPRPALLLLGWGWLAALAAAAFWMARRKGRTRDA